MFGLLHSLLVKYGMLTLQISDFNFVLHIIFLTFDKSKFACHQIYLEIRRVKILVILVLAGL